MNPHNKPLYRYSPDTREDRARMFVGKRVQIIEHPGRWAEQERAWTGELVSVATSPTGNGASIVVLRIEGCRLDSAITLANVASIRQEAT